MIETISSPQNHRVKKLKRLLNNARERRNSGLFVVENPKMLLEAPPGSVEEIYLSQAFFETLQDERIREMLGQCYWARLSNNLFNSVADTMHPQGVMAVVRQPEYEIQEILDAENPLIVMLEHLRDPGNLGTIFRTACCAGASGLILSPSCVDAFSPKVVRSSMSGIFSLPFAVAEDFEEVIGQLRERGITVCAADLRPDGVRYDEDDLVRPVAVVIGNEGAGVSERIVSAADHCIYIPMERGFESLNAAMAAGIIMYESHRQRKEV